MTGDSNSPPRKLDAAASYQMFTWLQGPYAEVAAARDFQSISPFEQWDRLHQYVKKVGYLVAKGNVASLDDVSHESSARLLQWLEEQYQRNRRATQPQTQSSAHLLHIKA
jgi:hypothetical protein